MPCNDHQPLCGEGSTTNNDVLEGHDTTASSSTNGNVEPTIEERRVSICASAESAQSPPQAGQHEHKNNSSRSRAMSSRSINLQSIALPGEELVSSPDNENCVTMESCQLFLTQYRLIIVSHNQNAMCAIPLTGVDSLEAKDIIGLQISCKDGRIIKFRAENSEMACAWYKKLMQKTCIARDLSNIFAFKFYSENVKEKFPSIWLRKEAKKLSAFDQLRHEFLRLKLNENNWRISDVNETFEVCPTYPQYLIVPSSIKSDEELKQMSFGRYYRRFPTLVWRNRRNGAVLLRSSQPSIGFFGMSNDKDVTLYDRIRAAISTDPNYKFLIVDARSYTAAWANRAKGGGFEGADTYINAEVVFMGLPNIHNIRYSFHQLRQLLNAGTDPNTYLQTLQSTLWLQNIGQLFTATERCLNSLCSEGTSVLVHCSDGWDRTTQIVSLCMLIADPYYRTFDGFEMLIQRQWVEFGHKFGDRGGVLNSDDNEKSPVFLQFLDCVFQLWMKNSNLFEFNRRYLLKLMQHTFSGLFGTFLFNSIRDAIKNGYDPYDSDEHKQKCYQIWAFLGKHNPEFRNPAYNGTNKTMLEYPKIVPDLVLWKEAYCCTAEQSMINNPDDSMHQSNGTGSTQDITSDKASSTLSRSQSAASLTSLHEQNQPNYSNCNNFLHSNGTTTPGLGNLSVKLNESCSIGSIYSTSTWQGQAKLDVDGLSMFPLQYEDYVRRRILELERQLCQHQQQACKFAMTATAAQNMRDGYMNMNGKLPNGTTTQTIAEGLGNGTTRRIRNESVESSFEVVDRLKHNSSSSLTSVFQPSSYSSNSTILSDYTPVNNGICKNGTLQEGIETEQMDGNGTDGLEMLHSRS